MSIGGRKVSVKVVAAMVALVVMAVMLSAMSRTPSREITLVARGMAFYLEGDPTTPNPTLRFKAGERVRIVLRNRERGMIHDLVVPAVGAATDALKWSEEDEVTLELPQTPGAYEYFCRPHLLMMRGTIEIE